MQSFLKTTPFDLAMPETGSHASLYTENSFAMSSFVPACDNELEKWDPSSLLKMEEDDFSFFEPASEQQAADHWLPAHGPGSIPPPLDNVATPASAVASTPQFQPLFDIEPRACFDAVETKSRSSSTSSVNSSELELVMNSPESVTKEPESPNLGIEDYKRLLADARSVIRHLTHEIQQLRQNPATPSQTCAVAPVAPCAFRLEPKTPVQTLWYAERPFPNVSLELVAENPAFNELPNEDVYIRVSALDANDQPLGEVLTGPASSLDFTFRMTDNIATINGIRFGTVSSKHGGFFRLCVSVCSPSSLSSAVTTWVSDKIQVLSYRLYNSPKIPFDQLRPKDDLTRVQGIGSLYAKRFASLGIKCVADLAALQFDCSDGTTARDAQEILDALRRDRGSMTRAKLEKYIKQAKEIVRNFQLKAGGATKRPAESAFETQSKRLRVQ